MGVCSNQRCAQPNPGTTGRCLTCNSLLVDRLLRDRYLIREMVSRGGFGATYLIHDQDCFDEPRLLKELRPPSSHDIEGSSGTRKETAERLFKREAQTLLNLNHSGIPKLYAYFILEGFSYLIQEYIPGRTLAQTVEERKENFSEEEARTLLIELAEILRYLHSQQQPIIHRDIKPQNLMRHTDGRLLLIDFGAVCRAANRTKSGQTLIGSPGYASPEQIMGQPVIQSDLYSAGVTVVRLLTGIHPTQLTNKKTDRMEWEEHTNVSRPFRDLINELLVRDPARRLGSAAELIRWIKEMSIVPPLAKSAERVTEVAVEELVFLLQETATIAADTDVTPPPEIIESSIVESSIVESFVIEPKKPSTVGIITALSRSPRIESGSLADVPVPVLLFRCYHSRVSGILSCTSGNVTKTIHFDQGAILFAASSRKEERLSEQLLRAGRLSQKDFERATRYVDESGQRMGSTLLQLGLITLDELTPLIVEHVSNLGYSIFEWTEGSYKFDSCLTPPEVIKMPFSTADIIFEGIRRLNNLELIKQWLGGFNRCLRTTTDPLLLYQTVTLNPREAYIVSRIDSPMSVEDLLSLGGLPENETLRTVCGLLAIGMLEMIEEEKKSDLFLPATPVGNVLSQPDPLPQDFDFSTAAYFCYEVESKLRSIENRDSYNVLEVDRHAHDAEIAEAYQGLARKFHPDRHSQLLNYNLSLRADLEKIFNAIAAAYETLNTKEKRSRYDMVRANKIKNDSYSKIKPVSTKVDAVQIEPDTDKFSRGVRSGGNISTPNAKEWLQRGNQYYRVAKYEQARAAFERAVEMAPNEAEHHLQLARALAHIAGNFQMAESQFYRALDLSPENADYYAELGLFYQRFSLSDLAQSMFKRCLQLSSDHPVAKRCLRR
jgi:serine/threonine protein kinase/curved DNA-binding protein CbpA